VTVYQLGDTVTLTWATPSNTATVVLYVTAPDGTQTAPVTSYSGGAWTASFVVSQYDEWLFTWVSSGTFVGRLQGEFTVGGPWYTTLARLRARINREDLSADSQLADALDAAKVAIEQHCDDRVFLLDASTSQRTFPTDRRLSLSQGWVLRVDDIGDAATITAEVGDGTTWTTLTDIEVYPVNATAKAEAIIGLTSQTDWSLYRLARITAKWGWPAVPKSVSQAHLMQAHRLYYRKNTPQGIAGGGEAGMMRLTDVDPDVAKLLFRFTAQFLAA
jgi:hypothetical protein